MNPEEHLSLVNRNNRMQAIASIGAQYMIWAIEGMIRLADSNGKEDPAAMASVFVRDFFAAIETNELDTPLQRAIKAEITERVFPSKQA